MKKLIYYLSLCMIVGSLYFSNIQPIQAQCPMCKMSAESNLKNGGTEGKGLNNGILYMFLTPYLLVGVIGYMWYRRNKQAKAEEASQRVEM